MFFCACSIEGFDLRRCRGAVLVGTLVPDDAGMGRSTPLHPLGRRGARGFTPSRALPGTVRSEILVSPTKQASSAFGTAVHVLPRLFGQSFRLPTKPRGCSDRNFVSDDAGVGRSAPLHPLGDGMREGSHPLALSRGCSVGGFGFRRNRRAVNFSLRHFCFRGGLHENFVPDRTGARRVAFIGAFTSAAICTKISFLTKQARDALRSSALLLSRRCKRRFRFRRRGAWGALLPYTPSGTGCERVATLSRSPGGCSIATSDFEKMPVAFLWERKRVNRIFSHRDSGAASLSRGTHAQRSSGGRDASEAHTLSLRRTGNL